MGLTHTAESERPNKQAMMTLQGMADHRFVRLLHTEIEQSNFK